MLLVQYCRQEDKVWLDSNKRNGVTVTTLWSTIWSDMDPYLCTSTQIQMQKKTSVTYRKGRQGDVAYQTVYSKMQKIGLFKGNKPRKKSIKADSDTNKMLAKEKPEGNERVRLRHDAAERKAAHLAEEGQRRRGAGEYWSCSFWGHPRPNDQHWNAPCKKAHSKRVRWQLCSCKTQPRFGYGVKCPYAPAWWIVERGNHQLLYKKLSCKPWQRVVIQRFQLQTFTLLQLIFVQTLFDEKNNDHNLCGKYNYNNVASWGSSEVVPVNDIFDLKCIFNIINEANIHWVLAMVFMEEKKICWYNSLGGIDCTKFNRILQYLKDE